jgi:hypothetical protein
VVLPRLADVLSPHGLFAILDVNGDVVGDTEALRRARQDLLQRYATYRRPTVNLLGEMERRGLFREEGRRETEAVPLLQSVDDYVEAFHAHIPHARERMAPADVAAFDAALRTLMLDHMGETVELAVRGFVLWGKPLRPEG